MGRFIRGTGSCACHHHREVIQQVSCSWIPWSADGSVQVSALETGKLMLQFFIHSNTEGLINRVKGYCHTSSRRKERIQCPFSPFCFCVLILNLTTLSPVCPLSSLIICRNVNRHLEMFYLFSLIP